MNIKTKRIIIIFLVVVAILYIAIYGVPKIQGLMEKTQILEYGELPVSDNAEVLILRTESLYMADVSGNVDYLTEEGTKVRSGIALVNINPAPAPETQTEEDGKETEEPKETVYQAISVIAGDSAIENPGNLAQFTGVFSTYADGYEQKYNATAIGSLKRKDLEAVFLEPMDLRREYVYKGEPIYKITDNTVWHMVYWIKEKESHAEDYNVGDVVQVILGKATVNASIESVEKESGYYKIVLLSDVFYEDLPKVRKVEAEIRFGEYEGLIVDEECVTERDGQKGVFVKQRSGSFEWTPIQVKTKSKGKYVVEAVVYYDPEGNPVDTVIYYDEVLRNPKQ
ncbi:MAG: hypothetical protein LBU41_01630 [Clostridiales Family XIII bacterium]|jgi:putative membrane fusion protein|nr:hypothetical protein [Clostridiales Family XIII bacterium]